MSEGTSDLDLRVDVVDDGSAPLVRLSGELDISGAGRLQAALADLFQRHPHTDVTIEMAALRFMDSTGLGVLLAATRRAAPARIVLRGASPMVLRLLDVAGCASLFVLES